jgi:tRNA dimethylallyltransferase
MAGSRKLLAIIGPTASGKSTLAMETARKTGAEILSADSMQVYRGMDIGTAKPTQQERAEVVHHLIDVVEPTESFTVARFVDMADGVIATARSPLIVVGGTPLYYKALFEGLFEGPGADELIRERLSAADPGELHARLVAVDPEAAARIHVNDRKRLIRALEVHELTGRSISSLQTEWESGRMRHEAVWVGLQWEREGLNRRINARVKGMIAGRWVEETRALVGRFGELSSTAAEATGYRELIEHVRGRMSLEDAVEQIKIATRQLARRQMKWLKRFKDVHWIAGDAPLEEQVRQVLARWP